MRGGEREEEERGGRRRVGGRGSEGNRNLTGKFFSSVHVPFGHLVESVQIFWPACLREDWHKLEEGPALLSLIPALMYAPVCKRGWEGERRRRQGGRERRRERK